MSCFFVFFYYAQVSIAGQPGGVEAARVKIRVSRDSRDLNSTRGEGGGFGGWGGRSSRKHKRHVGLWPLPNIFLTSHDDLGVTVTSLASKTETYLLYFISICLCFSSGSQKRIVFVWIGEQLVCFFRKYLHIEHFLIVSRPFLSPQKISSPRAGKTVTAGAAV